MILVVEPAELSQLQKLNKSCRSRGQVQIKQTCRWSVCAHKVPSVLRRCRGYSECRRAEKCFGIVWHTVYQLHISRHHFSPAGYSGLKKLPGPGTYWRLSLQVRRTCLTPLSTFFFDKCRRCQVGGGMQWMWLHVQHISSWACVCVCVCLRTHCRFDVITIELVLPFSQTHRLCIVWPADVLHSPIYTITAAVRSVVNLSATFTPSGENLDNDILSSFSPLFLRAAFPPDCGLWPVTSDDGLR